MDWRIVFAFVLVIVFVSLFYFKYEVQVQQKVQIPKEQVSFEKHIRQLFRQSDIITMKRFGLDLSDYNDVKDNASKIFERVSDGSMPCDGGWDSSKVELFKKWIDDGMIL